MHVQVYEREAERWTGRCTDKWKWEVVYSSSHIHNHFSTSQMQKKHKYFIQTLHFNATDQNTWDNKSIWVVWSVKSGWHRYRGDRASLACRWWRTPPGSGRSSQAVDRAEQQDQLLGCYLMPSQPQKSSQTESASNENNRHMQVLIYCSCVSNEITVIFSTEKVCVGWREVWGGSKQQVKWRSSKQVLWEVFSWGEQWGMQWNIIYDTSKAPFLPPPFFCVGWVVLSHSHTRVQGWRLTCLRILILNYAGDL